MSKRKVLLGVTGCIAAYKSCEIARALQKADVEVSVVMTENATRFVGIDTFNALSRSCAAVDNFGCAEDPIPHIRYGEGCDLFLIAPCTANMLAKLASGIADDLVSTTALVAHDKLAVAPAMNVNMYMSGAVQENIRVLEGRGVEVIAPGRGYLACGDVGEGRLADIGDIMSVVLGKLNFEAAPCRKGDLAGSRVLITAGPTRERIDPVRFISNSSSGKMGYAIADAAYKRGADVRLVSGPVSISAPTGVDTIYVETAQQMLDACEEEFSDADIAIFCAAVSDMRPRHASERKLKKDEDDVRLRSIELIENPDILKTLASEKRADQVVVGFAAETDNVIGYAKKKLESKGADLIVANEVGEGKGFGQDAMKAFLIDRKSQQELPEMQKADLANRILDRACEIKAVC